MASENPLSKERRAELAAVLKKLGGRLRGKQHSSWLVSGMCDAAYAVECREAAPLLHSATLALLAREAELVALLRRCDAAIQGLCIGRECDTLLTDIRAATQEPE